MAPLLDKEGLGVVGLRTGLHNRGQIRIGER